MSAVEWAPLAQAKRQTSVSVSPSQPGEPPVQARDRGERLEGDRQAECDTGQQLPRHRAALSARAGRNLRPCAPVRRERKLDREGRALPRLRDDVDRAVHLLCQRPGDVEAEAGAADPAGEARVRPEELLEDARLRLLGDADPLVADGDPGSALRP